MLKPFDARVVVKKPHREEQTESGIFLPDTVNEQGQTALGEVLAVGQGSRNMNTGEYMPIPIKKVIQLYILSSVRQKFSMMVKNTSL